MQCIHFDKWKKRKKKWGVRFKKFLFGMKNEYIQGRVSFLVCRGILIYVYFINPPLPTSQHSGGYLIDSGVESRVLKVWV